MASRPLLIALLVAGLPATALAEPLIDGSVIEFEWNLVEEDGTFTPISSNDPDFQWERQFNLARCYCGGDDPGNLDRSLQFGIEFSIDPTLDMTVEDPIHVWLGIDCLNVEPTSRQCGGDTPQHEFGNASDLNTPQKVAFNVYELHNANGDMCMHQEYTGGVYAAPATEGSIDYGDDELFESTWEIDTRAPPVPDAFVSATGSENGVYLDWEPIVDNEEDIYKWQVLCGRVEGNTVVPISDEPSHDALWETAEDLCGLPTIETYIADPPAALPEPLRTLDPDYVCGEADGAVSDIRIDGLENNVEYWVVLVAVDEARNVAGIAPATALTPQSVVDFWEDLDANGSEVEGGFCMVGPRSSGSGALVSLLLVLAVAWRRRRALVLAAAILVAPAAARAQSFAPYWEDETDVEDDGLADIKWHAGIKLGPYVPAIDDQLGVFDADGKGPYERVYGGYEILPVLEVDRLVWHPPGGQLGLGGSVGVMGKTANSFRFVDGNGDGIYQPGEEITRSKGDRTKFRLVPVAANVIYRLTLFDDEWGIPVIPYLRGGLAYYIWWNTKPDGSVSVVDGNKARGASLGLQGSAGLAVRAEAIDGAAAASMRDGGIYHAGFYAEYQLGWVDGFGSEKKLAVGDNTWFAGVNFEF